MRNLCLSTLFMASAFLMSVGCSPTSVNQGAAPAGDATGGITAGDANQGITESIKQDWLKSVEERKRSLTPVNLIDNQDAELTLSVEIDKDGAALFAIPGAKAGVHVYAFKGYVGFPNLTEPRHVLSRDDAGPGRVEDQTASHEILYIERKDNGLEGEIRVVSGATVQYIKTEGGSHMFDYDYRVKAFFKYLDLESDSENNQSEAIVALFQDWPSIDPQPQTVDIDPSLGQPVPGLVTQTSNN